VLKKNKALYAALREGGKRNLFRPKP